jgi:ketosteroid isomerase-like protein
VTNEQIAREYLAALEQGDVGESLRRFLAPDFEQVEFPNALNPKGQRSDLASVIERSLKGKLIMKSQRYAISSVVAAGDRVAIELEWTGVLTIPVASIPAGGEMRAHFAIFLEFRDGKIVRQRNYDCFVPF